jgi:ABC-2 type transport system permease protein
MITTRRGEGVLKRLRTGESRDWQIQAAPALLGVALTLVGAALVAAVVYGFGSPAPVNPVAMVLALAIGFVLFSFLALATSGITKNAEAAQITSIPVLTIAVLGLASIRRSLPDGFGKVVEWTPFSAISDLMSLGAAGKLATAPKSGAALDFTGTFGEFGRPLATLAIWTAAAFPLAHRSFGWDDRG